MRRDLSLFGWLLFWLVLGTALALSAHLKRALGVP